MVASPRRCPSSLFALISQRQVPESFLVTFLIRIPVFSISARSLRSPLKENKQWFLVIAYRKHLSHWLALKSHTVGALLLIYSVLVIYPHGAACNPPLMTLRTFHKLVHLVQKKETQFKNLYDIFQLEDEMHFFLFVFYCLFFGNLWTFQESTYRFSHVTKKKIIIFHLEGWQSLISLTEMILTTAKYLTF